MNEQRLYGILNHKENDRDSPHRRVHPPLPPASPRVAVAASTTVKSKGMEMTSSSNKLLAGYMAHEFRTKGTVLGHKLEGDRAEKGAVVENERYKEITSLLMMRNDGGVHIPGVVNPAQLARWIQM
ncbi:hypothetical protein HanHA300_Chr01g0028361 [Helianthus annuus]|nr:hypothetical protein HanHA300_Chr01g0028361 [Helianthus annuus]KAJ0957965.1 hypothetical protein HanPSC8_Chr01g0033771 [Helianthus annuus]